MSNRVGRAQRATSESQISVVIDLDEIGRAHRLNSSHCC